MLKFSLEFNACENFMAKKEIIHSVKGTRDYYPEDMGIRTWMYGKIRQVSEAFGYSEYEGPILEKYELYAAKSSEEIVEKQSYVFTDRGGDKLILRPELTPTLARMVASRQPQLIFPLRWWSFGPFWRYERPQKGRKREFFQWNIDMIGDPSPEADAELINIAATFLKSLGLKPDEVQILVNDRRLMDEETLSLGITEELRRDVYQLIDRKEKMLPEKWVENAEAIGLNNKQIEGLEKIIEDYTLWEKSDELTRIFQSIEAYGTSDYVQFAPHVIRGFVYYTGPIFEAWDTAGDFRALFGGGRYDNLVEDVGGQPVGAVGFALGDLVITLFLKMLERLPQIRKSPAEVFVTTFDKDHLSASLKIGNDLRQAGFNVTNHLKIEKLSKQFKYADKIGAKLALVLGPEELDKGGINVKNLETGEQKYVLLDELEERIREQLEGR